MLQLENIERLPEGVRRVVQDYVQRLLTMLPEDVQAVLVYGSAAGKSYQPSVSDINIAVVLTHIDFALLTRIKPLVAAGLRKRISAPLLLTPTYIQTSRDVFALEFNAIKQQHLLIAGNDFFSKLLIDNSHIRFCCEQQLRGMVVRLRQLFLETGHDQSRLNNVLKDSLNGLFPLLVQLMQWQGRIPSADKRELLKQAAAHFKIDEAVLLAIFDSPRATLIQRPSNVYPRFELYTKQIEKLAFDVDRS